MRFGQYDCFSLEMGSFLLDGGAMFGVVPKVLWEKKIPADAKNRIPMKGRALLLKGSKKNILVDTGCGSKLDSKYRKIYGIEELPTDTSTLLADVGISENDITDVILTHLHFDHAGGATRNIGGDIVPSFPNARYYVHKDQWETALSPTERERASYFPENYMPLKEKGVLTLLDDGENPIDGIEFCISNGHTKGQILPIIKCESKALFYCGDLIPTSAHIPVAWHMGYDNYPTQIIKEKKEILDRAVRENWVLFFEHDPLISSATLKKTEKGVELFEIINV